MKLFFFYFLQKERRDLVNSYYEKLQSENKSSFRSRKEVRENERNMQADQKCMKSIPSSFRTESNK